MVKESLFADSFKAGRRTYFFDIKETTEKKRFLTITESKKLSEKFERRQIQIFEEDIREFSKTFNATLLNFYKSKTNNKKRSRMDVVKSQYENAYKPWTDVDDLNLELLYCEGYSNIELVINFKRNIGGIKSRIKKLELSEKYPDVR